LIEDVLHNPNFNAAEVDTDILQRFANSIDIGDLDIISMHLDGDGAAKQRTMGLRRTVLLSVGSAGAGWEPPESAVTSC
jgi:hypothetical protein